MNAAAVSYVTTRQPFSNDQGEFNYFTEVYKEGPPKVMVAARAFRGDDAVVALYVVDDVDRVEAEEYLEKMSRNWSWSADWHDSYTVAEATFHNMKESEQ